MNIDWSAIWAAIWKELLVVYHAVGFGGGALALQLLRFMPAPYEDQPIRGWLMDATWTVAGQSRAGERRTRSGETIGPNKPLKPVLITEGK